MSEPNPPVSVSSGAWTAAPRPWGWGDLLAIAVWSLAIIVFFWKAVSLSEAFFYFDITEINYPYRDFLAKEMKLGRFSRWFPGLYCGQPLYSESQAGYWHPLKYFLYPFLDTWKAFNLDTVLSVWLTGLGTYGWLRRHVSAAGALTGAAIFGLSGFVWAHLIHTSMTNALISVPLVIWCLEVAWDDRRWRGVFLGALALASQVFAGHLQDTLLTASLVGVYSLYRACTEPRWGQGAKAIGVASILVTLGVAIAAVQWIPSKELLDRSPRAGGLSWQQLTYGSWHPELLPTMVVREAYGTRARDTDWMDGFYPYHEMNAYVGLVAIALAVVGGAAGKHDRWVSFWIIVGWLALLLMLGKFTFLFDHLNRVPIFGSSRIPVRFHLWMSLAVATLAAVGVDRLGREGAVNVRSAIVLSAAMVVASIPILVYVYHPVWTDTKRWTTPYHVARYGWLGRELLISSGRTLIIALSSLALVLSAVKMTRIQQRSRLIALLPVLIIIDLLGSHLYDAPTITPAYWTTPPESAQIIQHDPTAQRIFGISNRSAGEPGYASEPVNFLAARDGIGWSLAPVWGLSSSSGETPIIPRRMLEYTDNAEFKAGRFDIEGVTHVLSGGVPLHTVDRDPKRIGSIWLHRNAGALPRVRLVGKPIYAADEAEAVRLIKPTGKDLLERVIVEDPDRPLPPSAEVAGTARIVDEIPEHLTVEADCQTPAYLFLADCFDPGWWATVDGQPAPIRPADVAFRAIFLKPGKHKVEFFYRPAGFRAGLAITSLGLVLGLLLLLGPWSIPTLTDPHVSNRWLNRWPLVPVGILLACLLVSAIQIGPGGSVSLHERWKDSFHMFTWGAGVEAMNPMRESVGR